MSSRRANVRLSKFLSLVLRHAPERIDLRICEGGWAEIDELLEKARVAGVALTREALLDVVATNEKQRFALSEDGRRVRASQGHSIPVDLGLEPTLPPELLYHGTAERFLRSIRRDGLMARGRRHVHLSPDADTARTVGRRHGDPVVLEVDAAAMARDGRLFFRSDNGVWLADHVPPEYLS